MGFKNSEYSVRFAELENSPHLQKKLSIVYDALENPIFFGSFPFSFDSLHSLEQEEKDFFIGKSPIEVLNDPHAGLDHLIIIKKHGDLLRAIGTNANQNEGNNFFRHYLRSGAVLYNLSVAQGYTRFHVHLPENYSPNNMEYQLSDMVDKPYIVPSVRAILVEGVQNITK